MKHNRAERIFWGVIISVAIVMLLVILAFAYFMLFRLDVVPPTHTYWSFWIPNGALLIAALAFSASATAGALNALEQRNLRYMENYPYLEVFPIHTVDPLPLPIPKVDIPPVLDTFNVDYLQLVAPGHPVPNDDSQIRYLAVVLRNVGHSTVTLVKIEGTASVPGRGFPSVPFRINRRFNLQPGGTWAFTLLPISGLPEYKVVLDTVEYQGHFIKLRDFDGPREFNDVFPYQVPDERRVTLLLDHFLDVPAGQGWVLDFWGTWQPTDYCHVPMPTLDDHYLILSGDELRFREVPHFNGLGGAYRDLPGAMPYGQTVRVTATIRAVPGTTASVAIWCHDIAPNPKNRYSRRVTPGQAWEEISMLYTATDSTSLRVHLLYSPGLGEIQVDKVLIEGLYT